MKFVSKELAIKLKDKGFDRPCFGYYREDKDEDILYLCETKGNVYGCLKRLKLGCIIHSPTIEQVLEWLRKEKNIHIVIDFTDDMVWYFQISKYYTKHYEHQQYGYNSYDDACIAGIEYVINNLI